MDDISILEQQAIDAAINIKWSEAIILNKKLLQSDKNNMDGLLRLAFAYLQSNKITDAKKCYKKASKLQPGNRSVIDSLERIKILESRKNKPQTGKEVTLNPNLFLETPGKTKSIVAVNPGQKNILVQLTVGQTVFLIPKKRKIEVRTKNKEYIGSLPDDMSKRLTIFLKAGSEFKAFIKEASLNKIVVFIREEKKGKKVMKYTSFPTNIQSKLSEIADSQGEESAKDEDEEITDNDLDKLAEVLATEEKEYLPFGSEEQDEEPEE